MSDSRQDEHDSKRLKDDAESASEANQEAQHLGEVVYSFSEYQLAMYHAVSALNTCTETNIDAEIGVWIGLLKHPSTRLAIMTTDVLLRPLIHLELPFG
jgi:hypothetical protein